MSHPSSKSPLYQNFAFSEEVYSLMKKRQNCDFLLFKLARPFLKKTSHLFFYSSKSLNAAKIENSGVIRIFCDQKKLAFGTLNRD